MAFTTVTILEARLQLKIILHGEERGVELQGRYRSNVGEEIGQSGN
jgi:hypothetical protein